MLKILRGRQVRNFKEAAALAFQEAGVGDMSLEVAELFTSAIDTDKRRDEADRVVSSTVHSKYGRNATWSGKRWLIPVPRLGYNVQPIPQLEITIQAYLASSTEVETTNHYYHYYSMALIGPIGGVEKLVLPMPFLQAVLDDDLDQFDITGRDSAHTVWSIPGLKEAIRLPADFTTKLSGVLRLKTVAEWLQNFGSEGKKVTPWVVGTLIGLQLHGMIEPSAAREQPYKRENVLARLTQLYGREWAEEMFTQGAPFLRANMTDREAFQCILQEADKFRRILHKEL